MTSPVHRHYDDTRHHASNYPVCDRDSQPVKRVELVGADAVDSLHRGRRLDLAAAAGGGNDDADDDDDARAARHNDVTRTAVRPWLLHSCDH